MSAKYEKVKGYYDKGLWNIRQVHDAVAKKWITAKEYEQITGKEYDESGADEEEA